MTLKLFETTDKGKTNQLNSLVNIDSDQGQLIFLTDSNYFPDTDWDEIKKQGILYFSVDTDDDEERDFSIVFKVGENLTLSMGSNFVTKISPEITNLEINEKYFGKNISNIHKIRF